jgi:hypothetical protein
MIRYSIALSTLQTAANPFDSGRIFAAQSARKRGSGLFKQTGFWHDAPDLDWRDGSHLFNSLLVLLAIPVSTVLPVSMGLSVVGRLLGQQLERDWWTPSGRYGCNTVPRQD